MYLLTEQTYPPTTYEMFRRLNRLLAAPLEGDLEGPFNSFSSGDLMTNVHEDKDSVYVEMEVPGVKPEEVDISLVGTELTVKIRHEEKNEAKEKNEKNVSVKDRPRYLRRERFLESVVRTIDLPMETPPKDVNAKIEDGILRITLHKAEPAKVKKIEVAAAAK